MAEDLTDSQKIDQLWEKLNRANEREESLKLLCVKHENTIDRQKEVISQLESTVQALTDEIRRISVELNAARQAAATSVQDYISRVG